MKPFFAGIFLCAVFALTLEAHAAGIYLDPASAETGIGGTVILNVRLDTTAEECINAIDGVLRFDDGLAVEDVSVGNSIFNFWVESPKFDNDDRLVTFAGGIPNGYCGRVPGDPSLTNTIAEIIVRPDVQVSSDTIYNVYFDDLTKGYLNDGLGTPIPLFFSNAQILVTGEYVGGADDEWINRIEADTQPPKEFSIELAQNDTTFKGEYFIAFNTNDKQTGVDHYEVIEEPFDEIELFGWGAATAPWVRAVSPYKLKDQSLNSTIRVKAVDKAGNEYIATLIPDESIRGVNKNAVVMYGLALVLLTILLITIWFIFHLWVSRREHDFEIEDIEIDPEADGNENHLLESNQYHG